MYLMERREPTFFIFTYCVAEPFHQLPLSEFYTCRIVNSLCLILQTGLDCVKECKLLFESVFSFVRSDGKEMLMCLWIRQSTSAVCSFRFMATNDLMMELQKDSIKLDEDSEKKVVKMLLKLLEDKNGEVQNLAVKW